MFSFLRSSLGCKCGVSVYRVLRYFLYICLACLQIGIWFWHWLGIDHSPYIHSILLNGSSRVEWTKNLVAGTTWKGIYSPKCFTLGYFSLVCWKKDSIMRISVDYRYLNKVTIGNKYPLCIDNFFTYREQWFSLN